MGGKEATVLGVLIQTRGFRCRHIQGGDTRVSLLRTRMLLCKFYSRESMEEGKVSVSLLLSSSFTQSDLRKRT